MAIGSSLQQVAGGLASLAAGLIVVEGVDGKLEHFDTLGYILVLTALVSTYTMFLIHRSIPEPTAKD
jgi:hypothetical protein